MGFTARHPRYTIALIVLLFVSILIFANSDPPRYMPGSYVVRSQEGETMAEYEGKRMNICAGVCRI